MVERVSRPVFERAYWCSPTRSFICALNCICRTEHHQHWSVRTSNPATRRDGVKYILGLGAAAIAVGRNAEAAARYHIRKESSLCMKCPNKAIEGQSRCLACAERHRRDQLADKKGRSRPDEGLSAAPVQGFRAFPGVCHRPNDRRKKTTGTQDRTVPCAGSPRRTQ